MSSRSQLKSRISRNWPVITLCISLATHHKMGIQRTDKFHSAKYCHNINTSLTEKTADTIYAGFLAFLTDKHIKATFKVLD